MAPPPSRVTYCLLCDGRSVTTNTVSENLLVLNPGGLITVASDLGRPHIIRLEIPPSWKLAISGLVPVDMAPLSPLCRLATTGAPPRFHTIHYAGVLAAASPWRSRVNPPLPPTAEDVREACPVQCSKVVFGCERQSLPKRQRPPPEDLRRIRMPIGNHVQQEVCAADHERQYRA